MHVVLDTNIYPKFKAILQPYEVGSMINTLQHAVILTNLPYDIEIEADDPSDTFLSSMALVGKVDYLVTGDHRSGLLQKKNIERTRIVSPTVFCLEALKSRSFFNKK